MDEILSRNLTGGVPRFWDNDTWSWNQKNLFLTPWYLCQNFMLHVVAAKSLERIGIVTHRYTAVFSWKVSLCETNNIFYSQGDCIWHKMNSIFWKYIKNKSEVTLNSFQNFAYINSYLGLKSFAWKQNYATS